MLQMIIINNNHSYGVRRIVKSYFNLFVDLLHKTVKQIWKNSQKNAKEIEEVGYDFQKKELQADKIKGRTNMS